LELITSRGHIIRLRAQILGAVFPDADFELREIGMEEYERLKLLLL